MESKDENDLNSTEQIHKELKIGNRRRSSIFRIQPIVSKDELTSDKELISDPWDKEYNNEEEKKTYLKSFEKEKNDWKTALKTEKTKYSRLSEELKNNCKQEIDLSVLSDSQRAFLSDKPDFEAFSRNVDDLKKLSVKVVFLHECYTKLHSAVVKLVEDETQKLTQHIIKNLTE